VGDYHPPGRDGRPAKESEQIGSGRKCETFVFRVLGHGEHGEGEVTDWSGIDTDAYNEPAEAEQGHMEMCRKYARIAAGLEAEPSWDIA